MGCFRPQPTRAISTPQTVRCKTDGVNNLDCENNPSEPGVSFNNWYLSKNRSIADTEHCSSIFNPYPFTRSLMI